MPSSPEVLLSHLLLTDHVPLLCRGMTLGMANSFLKFSAQMPADFESFNVDERLQLNLL